MTLGFVTALVRSGVLQVLMVSAPVLLIAVGVGLIISIFQATTSIQDQTLTFVPKIAAVMLALLLFGGWMFTALGDFTRQVIMQIPQMAK